MKNLFIKTAGVILIISSILGIAGIMENAVSIDLMDAVIGVLICLMLFGFGGLALIWNEDKDILNNL